MRTGRPSLGKTPESELKAGRAYHAKHKDDPDYKAMKAKNTKEWYQKHKNDPKVKADRKRNTARWLSNPLNKQKQFDRVKLCHKLWLKTPKGKEYHRKAARKWRQNHKNDPEFKAKQKLIEAKKWAKIKADPVAYATYKIRQKKKDRKRWANLMADPVKHEQFLAKLRLRYATDSEYRNRRNSKKIRRLKASL